MIWKAVFVKGKERLDRDALLKEMPEASRFVVRGKGFEQHRWVKERK